MARRAFSEPVSDAALADRQVDWFRALAENTSIAVFAYRLDRIVYANRACVELSGYSLDELLTMAPWELAHPEVRPAIRARSAARMSGQDAPTRYETRMLAKDGRTRWVDVTVTMVELAGERPAAMATAVDVTERKLAELALRESRDRLELAQRVAGLITWEWDLLTDRLETSQYAADVTGLAPDDLWTTGRQFMASVVPEDQQRFAEELRQCLAGEKDFAIEVRVATPDMRVRWFSDRGRALFDAHGNPTRVIGVARDVTDRRVDQHTLRAVVEGTAAATGTNFLRSLVRHLAATLRVEYCVVCQLLPDRTRARVVALWAKEGYGEPFDYLLAGTPCATVFEREVTLFPSGVSQLFPEDRWLAQEAIESYLGVPLFNAEEQPIGHMAVLSTRPMAQDESAVQILSIFAARAAAEIERKAAHEALAQEKDLAQITLASIGDGVIRTDAAGLIDYMNPVAERLTGWDAAEACGQPVMRVFNVVDEATHQPLPNPVERCLKEGQVIELPGYSLLQQRSGYEFAIRDSVAPLRDRQGRITGSVLVFKDVTQLRGMEREMMHLARHDPLTGLINRREFERLLEESIASARDEGRRHALFYLDLDEFKVVNDTCGHLAGDEMLKQVTALLKSVIRRADVLARLGGDEFGVLLADTWAEQARELGERMRKAVKQYRFRWQERIFAIGVSVGLVPITPDTTDMAQALSAADAACYVAKESGRNRIHEYQPDDSALAERYGEMQWIHRIHKAFAEHRFCLFRQQIVALNDGAGEAPFCEIFIRMLDETGTIIAPASFIPAAERYHLIASIDRWVVHAAFVALACGTLSHGDTTRFALNLSGQSVGDDAFLDYVLDEVEATGIAPERIYFEITETAAVGNLAQATHFISVLKKLGFRFVLDDFGSGLSSFAYLKNLQVDFLKIDGSFVREMTGSRVQRALVESIHQIGKVMGIRTIAESVEDPSTLETLRDIGVDYAQGYAVSLPEPLI